MVVLVKCTRIVWEDEDILLPFVHHQCDASDIPQMEYCYGKKREQHNALGVVLFSI